MSDLKRSRTKKSAENEENTIIKTEIEVNNKERKFNATEAQFIYH